MLKCVTYNCNSVRNNSEVVKSILKIADVVLLQELMLSKSDLSILNTFDRDFDNVAFVQDRESEGINEGRPARGVAIFWRRQLSACITPLTFNDRIIGIVLCEGVRRVLLLNVYMPCDLQTIDALHSYREELAKLEILIKEQNVSNIIIAGDFNADPFKGRFWKELSNIRQSLSLTVVDKLLPRDSFTYLCPARSTTSWLDHILCTCGIAEGISDVYVNYEMALFDHFPLHFNFDFKLESNVCLSNEGDDNTNDAMMNKMVDWGKVSEANKNYIKSYIDNGIISSNILYHEVFQCKIKNCTNVKHIKYIDEIFESMKSLLLDSTEEFSFVKNNKFVIIPGWNDYVKNLHADARNNFLLWKCRDKPQHGQYLDNMKLTRTKFRDALKTCKENADQIRRMKLLGNLVNKNYITFWKEVAKINCNNNNESSVIDGEKDPALICHIFSEKYRKLFVKEKDNSKIGKTSNIEKANAIEHHESIRFSRTDVKEGISQLKHSIGADAVHSNHLKLCPDSYIELISEMYSSFSSHGYMPTMLLKGTIEPTVKDRFGNLSSSGNYRPVMSSSVFLKLFEYCILKKISPFVNLNDRQHGFRPNHSTSTACFVLKETVLDYAKSKTEVHACFVDIRKAFDSVDHDILMDKLLDSGIPVKYVNIIKYWYSNQFVKVRYKSELSNEWKIHRGVRQGGVLSGLLFGIYIDSLIQKISGMKYGCRLGIHSANVIVYADDMVLLAPSATGLQLLLNEAYKEAGNLGLEFNQDKSKYLVFNLSDNKRIQKYPMKVDNRPLEQVRSFKYLGYVLTDNLCNTEDINRVRNKFYGDFNNLLRKFYFADFKVKLFLFKQYCIQFYGCDMWFYSNGSSSSLKQFGIGYHKAIKKILGLSYHESNHYACQEASILIFEHLLNKIKINTIMRLFQAPCNFIAKLSYLLRISSVFLREINYIFLKKYGIESVFENDRDAIMSRICYVQNHETQMRQEWN